MRAVMEQVWHRRNGVESADEAEVDPVFIAGFEACCDLLMPLLIEAAPHVFASAGAEHMMDGFRPRRRGIDDLVERIKAVVEG